MLQSYFTSLLWAGIAVLLTAHVCVALGLSKRSACSLSAIGAFTALIAASGLGNQQLFIIILAWLSICAWGSLMPERRSTIGRRRYLLLLSAAIPLLSWISGPDAVIITATCSVFIGWYCFTAGLTSRGSYLAHSVLVGIALGPVPNAHNIHTPSPDGNWIIAIVIYSLIMGSILMRRAHAHYNLRPLW